MTLREQITILSEHMACTVAEIERNVAAADLTPAIAASAAAVGLEAWAARHAYDAVRDLGLADDELGFARFVEMFKADDAPDALDMTNRLRVLLLQSVLPYAVTLARNG